MPSASWQPFLMSRLASLSFIVRRRADLDAADRVDDARRSRRSRSRRSGRSGCRCSARSSGPAASGPPYAKAALILVVPWPGMSTMRVAGDRHQQVRAGAGVQQHDRVGALAAGVAGAELLALLGAQVRRGSRCRPGGTSCRAGRRAGRRRARTRRPCRPCSRRRTAPRPGRRPRAAAAPGSSAARTAGDAAAAAAAGAAAPVPRVGGGGAAGGGGRRPGRGAAAGRAARAVAADGRHHPGLVGRAAARGIDAGSASVVGVVGCDPSPP